MQLYKKYIIKELISRFILIFTILSFLIWLGKSVSYINYITENGIKIKDFIYLIISIFPKISLAIIPISIFIATILTYGRLAKNSELIIMNNSGISEKSLISPILYFGIFLALICFFITLYLMPLANKNQKIMRVNFWKNNEIITISPKIFTNFNKLTIYVDEKNKNSEFRGILVNDSRDSSKKITITASSGALERKDQNLLLILEDGSFQVTDKKDDIYIINFDNHTLKLNESKDSQRGIEWKSREMYIWELLNHKTSDISKKTRVNYEIHQRITQPLMPLILALIAAISIIRKNFSRHENIMAEIKAIMYGGVFIFSTIFTYGLLKSSIENTYLPYLNIAIAVIFLLQTTKKIKLK
jgi:lipopolysaccharide export system permease protein